MQWTDVWSKIILETSFLTRSLIIFYQLMMKTFHFALIFLCLRKKSGVVGGGDERLGGRGVLFLTPTLNGFITEGGA